MPDLIPAKDGIIDRHPEAENLNMSLDSGFRIKPVMTKRRKKIDDFVQSEAGLKWK